MKRLIALAGAVLLALATFLPAQAQSQTADPLLRAPLAINKGFNQAVAANTTVTTGATYTVPAGRMARIELIDLTVDGINIGGYADAVDGSSNQFARADNRYFTGAANGLPVEGKLNTWVYLYAGDTVNLRYINVNTTTAIFVAAYMRGTEFDAP